VFWLWVLASLIKNNYEYKPLWILVIIIGNFIGVITYYFAVNRELKIAAQKDQRLKLWSSAELINNSGWRGRVAKL
jgi:hypothetical protein